MRACMGFAFLRSTDIFTPVKMSQKTVFWCLHGSPMEDHSCWFGRGKSFTVAIVLEYTQLSAMQICPFRSQGSQGRDASILTKSLLL